MRDTRPRMQALAERRQRLLLRSAQLRVALAYEARALHAPLAAADRALAGWRWLRARPVALLGLTLAVAALRPRRALAWGARLWPAWTLARRWWRRRGHR